MYKSLKNEDGTYSLKNYLIQGWMLCNPVKINDKINKYMTKVSSIQRIGTIIDYYYCLVRYGTIAADYFEYEFWKKRNCVRKDYVTMTMNKRVKKIFNHEPIGVFRNKQVFNREFSEFRNLQTFDFENDSIDQFHIFCKNCNYDIIAKPLTGYSGLGIHKPDVSTEKSRAEVYLSLKKDGDFFCEEAFVQDGILHDVNPNSCNTIRIYTIHDGTQPHITFAGVRFGGSKEVVDNIHAGGMCCEVDLDSGTVIGKGYNLSGDCFVRHPVSGIVLPGIKIPQWETVIEMVLDAAKKYPNQGYVAWDVAVSLSKISILEGNDGGNFDLPQVCMQQGCKPLYDKLIEERLKNV